MPAAGFTFKSNKTIPLLQQKHCQGKLLPNCSDIKKSHRFRDRPPLLQRQSLRTRTSSAPSAGLGRRILQ